MLLKATIIACVICAGAGGTALWVEAQREVRSQETLTAMPTLIELHNAAHIENLPIQNLKDPL
jgi:hypothetical protein